MPARRRRAIALVVDADVARSCGHPDAPAARAQTCRDVLDAVRTAPLDVVMSREISEEWLEHASRYASKWLVKMRSSRRVVEVEPPHHGPTRRACHSLPNGVAALVRKDLHLVEAALATDRRVVSLDKRVRHHLTGLAQRIGELKRILWAPADDPACVAWIKRGAVEDPTWSLGASAGRPHLT